MRFFAFLAGCVLSTALPAAAPWTLPAALAEARAHSPAAAMAAARLERAQSMVDQAGAANLPQVTLKAGYSQTTNPMMAFGAILTQGAFAPTIDFNAPGQVDNLNLTGIVGYNLYSGGRATAGLAAARSGVAATEQDRATTFARLDAAVTRAYFGIRQAREGLVALDAAVATYEESLRVARLRYEAGQMLKSELLNLEVQLAQTREQHLLVRQQATLVARQFLYLLGGQPMGEVELADSDAAIAAITASIPHHAVDVSAEVVLGHHSQEMGVVVLHREQLRAMPDRDRSGALAGAVARVLIANHPCWLQLVELTPLRHGVLQVFQTRTT